MTRAKKKIDTEDNGEERNFWKEWEGGGREGEREHFNSRLRLKIVSLQLFARSPTLKIAWTWISSLLTVFHNKLAFH